MNIALFPSAFHPSLGGVEELTRQLALALKRQGHRVMVITERWPRDLPASEVIDGLDVRRFPMRVPTPHWKSKVSFALTHRRIRSAIVAELRRFQADVLHVQCVSSTTLYALHARRTLGLPLVVTLQGELTMDAAGIFDRPGIAQDILRRAMTEAEVLTGCSAKTLSDAFRFFGGRPAAMPSGVVFNGASVDEARAATPLHRRRPYVLALGRLVPQKGFDVLLDALPGNLPEGWDLLLAGDGPLREDLLRRLSEPGLRDRVDYVGRADRREVPALIKGSEFVVVPSRTDEGLPVVCAEAVAAGRPIIGTTMGGIPEVVAHGSNGLLVPPQDPIALGRAILQLASDEPGRRKMAAAAERLAGTFAWETISLAYVQRYEQALSARVGSGVA